MNNIKRVVYCEHLFMVPPVELELSKTDAVNKFLSRLKFYLEHEGLAIDCMKFGIKTINGKWIVSHGLGDNNPIIDIKSYSGTLLEFERYIRKEVIG